MYRYILAMERRLGEEKQELRRVTGEVGRHTASVHRERPARRVNLNMFHATTGAC